MAAPQHAPPDTNAHSHTLRPRTSSAERVCSANASASLYTATVCAARQSSSQSSRQSSAPPQARGRGSHTPPTGANHVPAHKSTRTTRGHA